MSEPVHADTTNPLRINLLGPLTVTLGGTDVGLAGPLRRALLARLAIAAPHPVPTATLLEDLWQEPDHRRTVASLRTYVSQLRRLLGTDRVRTLPSGYSLNVTAEELDTWSFQQTVTRTAAMTDEAAIADALDEALGLWRGTTPLAEFVDAPWASGAIVQLEHRRIEALTRRNDAYLAIGRHLTLCSELAVLAGQHPLHEPFWAQLIVALYRSGRQADALRSYQRARQILADELGIEPGPALRAIDQLVLSQDPALDANKPTASSGNDPERQPDENHPPAESCLCWLPDASLPFVGRDRELDQLLRALRDPNERTQLILVHGEPGIGKTRLVAEAARILADEGAYVIYGHVEEQPIRTFPVLSEIAQHLSIHTPGGLGSLLSDREVNELARLAPELASTHDGLGQPAETTLVQVTDALSAGLRRAAQGRRTILVAEDGQWVSPSSRSLFQAMLDSSFGEGLTVLITARDTDRTEWATVSNIVENLDRSGTLVSIALGGLSEDAVHELVLHAEEGLATELEPGLPERLWEESGGNALFVSELLQHLARHVTEGRAAGLPGTLRATIDQRVERLGDDASRLLGAAAVAGMRFCGHTVAQVAGLDDLRAADALDAALGARLIAERPSDGADWYQFNHALVRQAVYDGLSSARRLRLHRLVAQAMEADQDRYLSPAELSHHFVQAAPLGEAARAIRHLRRAAQSAANTYAFNESANLLDSAFALLASYPSAASAEVRCELHLESAWILHRLGDPTKARREVSEAARIARQIGRDDLLVQAALGYAGETPSAVYAEDTIGIGLLRDALAAVADQGGAEAAQLRALLAHALYWTAPVGERAELADAALAIARSLDDPALLAQVLTLRVFSVFGPGNTTERLTIGGEIEQLAQTLGDLNLSLRGGKIRLDALVELGALAQSDALSRTLEQLAVQVNQPEFVRVSLNYRAMRAGLRGDIGSAEKLIAEGRDLLIEMGQPVHSHRIFAYQIMPLDWLRGRFEGWEEIHAKLAIVDPGRPSWQASQALVAAESGRLSEASALLNAGDLPNYLTTSNGTDWWAVAAMTVWTTVALGDREMASRLDAVLRGRPGELALVGQITFLGVASHLTGLLAQLQARTEQAVYDLTAATVRYQHLGAQGWEAVARTHLATALAAKGDIDASGSESARAQELARSLGVALRGIAQS